MSGKWRHSYIVVLPSLFYAKKFRKNNRYINYGDHYIIDMVSKSLLSLIDQLRTLESSLKVWHDIYVNVRDIRISLEDDAK